MIGEIVTTVSNAFITSWAYLSGPFFERIIHILTSPYRHQSMLWMLLPLLATIIFMEFYLGRYKEEEFGWNTAYGNALLLIFVSIDLFRHVYEPLGLSIYEALTSGQGKIVISLVIFAFGLIMMFIDFFHFVPKKIAYAISSPAYVNMLAILGIIIVYSVAIPLNWTTLFACLLILAVFTGIGELIYLIVPSYHTPLQRILTPEDLEEFRRKQSAKKHAAKAGQSGQ